MKTYSTVLFDADGTLLDFLKDEHEAFGKLMTELEIPFGEATVKRYSEINDALWREFEKGLVTREQLKTRRFGRLFDEIGCQPKISLLRVGALYLEKLGEGGATIENAEAVLSALAGRGYKMHIVTNGVEHTQKRRLKHSGLDKYIDKCFVSESVGVQKPFPAFFDYVLSHIDETDKARVIVVGDSLGSDIKGAADSGLDSVWFNPCGKTNDVCENPNFEISDLSQLLGILG